MARKFVYDHTRCMDHYPVEAITIIVRRKIKVSESRSDGVFVTEKDLFRDRNIEGLNVICARRDMRKFEKEYSGRFYSHLSRQR